MALQREGEHQAVAFPCGRGLWRPSADEKAKSKQAAFPKQEEPRALTASSAKQVAAGPKGASASSAFPLTAIDVLAAVCAICAQARGREFEQVAGLARGACPAPQRPLR